VTDGGLSPELSIVIPAYNERENILATLETLEETVPVPHEIFIVYDTDEDTTLQAARTIASRWHHVQLIKNSIAKGPSGALRTGFAHSRAPWVLVAMADLCDDFTQIPQLLKLAANAQIVCPSRYCPGGQQELSGLKVWAPKTAGFLLKLLTGIATSDPTNSYKLYSRRLLQEITLKSTVSFSVTLEIVAKAHALGYRIAEVPTRWRIRKDGKTNFKLWRSLVVYMPWFGVALLRGRLFRLPGSILQSMFRLRPSSPSRPDD
jgi:dolichol-phosphate mannosyltransferase